MYEIDRRRFGAFLSSLRREKGMTQKQLAEKLYISDKAVSKWERGLSLPDISLLAPLAEALDVTASELLACGRLEPQSTVPARQVEDLVQAAIRMSGDEDRPAPARRRRLAAIYGAGLCVGALEAALLKPLGFSLERYATGPLTFQVLGACFGAYAFLLFRTKLPKYYDENRIAFVNGIFRVNLPGAQFNNRNWPHFLRVLRIWSAAALLGAPLVGAALQLLAPNAPWLDLAVVLPVGMISLFAPMYAALLKYK